MHALDERELLARHLCVNDDLGLGWQREVHVHLRAAEDVALQQRVELGDDARGGLLGDVEAAVGLAAALDEAVDLHEVILALEDAGHDEVAEGPELREVVLDGRAREEDLGLRTALPGVAGKKGR